MTYRSKHGGIASGIGAGQTNAALAAEHGVSRGMIQLRRGSAADGRRQSGGYHGPVPLPEEAEAEEAATAPECTACRDWYVEYGLCRNCGKEKRITATNGDYGTGRGGIC